LRAQDFTHTADCDTSHNLSRSLAAAQRWSSTSSLQDKALVTLSPVGDIPGVPTMVAVLGLLLSTQFLWGRSSFWLPGWLLRKSIARTTMTKSIGWLERPARFIDRCLRPRLSMFVKGFAARVIATVSLLISLAMPLMEVIPFSASGAGGALTAFGLALIARDGLMPLLALIFTGATGGADPLSRDLTCPRAYTRGGCCWLPGALVRGSVTFLATP
jgi:hypothetical protein